MSLKTISFTATEHIDLDVPAWEAAGRDDTRSPCPMLNALANHHLLPHNGRDVSKEMVQKAAAKMGADPNNIGKIFDQGANGVAKGRATGRIDLDQLAVNGVLEHDASMSRQCWALGDNLHFNSVIWMTTLHAIGDRETLDYKTAAKIRHMRFEDSVSDHKSARVASDFDLKALAIAYVEIATLFRLFADTKTGEVPVKYFRALVENERLPYDEGWKPYVDVAGRPSVVKIALSIIWAESGFYKVLFQATKTSARKLMVKVVQLFGFWRPKEA